MEGDAVEEAELDIIYAGTGFNNENEAYDAYNSYVLTKRFDVRKGRTYKAKTNEKNNTKTVCVQ